MTLCRWSLCLLMVCKMVLSYPNGAPVSTCEEMLPHHKSFQAQDPSTNPYAIKISANEVSAGEKLTIRVIKTAADAPAFKGFLIRASPLNSLIDARATGQIASFNSSSTKELRCFGLPQSAVTHNSAIDKSDLTFEWTAPNADGQYVFLATVVQSYNTFWAKFQSDTIRVKQGSQVFSSPTLAAKPEGPTFGTPNEVALPMLDFDYDTCGKSQSCFGLPVNCINDQSCEMVASYSIAGDKVQLHLAAITPGYVALGLSTDQFMGEDSVIECLTSSRAFASVNKGKNNYKSASDASYFTLDSINYKGGMLKCDVSRPIATTVMAANRNVGSVSTDLNANSYYLLLARGEMNAEGSDIEQHDLVGYSNIAVDLMSPEFLIVASNNKPALEIMIHGSLMVVAWIGTVSIAIFMARYYKDMWPKTMWCNVKVWFMFHRLLNMLTVLLTIAAFVLIFVYKNGFSAIWKKNPHPILGCITMGLAILQPIGALFRCSPGSKRRPIFNWFHYLIGNSTCIVAVVTMFFAVNLPTAHLPTVFWWILIAYIGFYVIMFLVMEYMSFVHHRKAEHDIIPMRDYNAHEGSLSSSMHQSEKHELGKLKHVMLFLFIFGTIGFAAALVAIICT